MGSVSGHCIQPLFSASSDTHSVSAPPWKLGPGKTSNTKTLKIPPSSDFSLPFGKSQGCRHENIGLSSMTYSLGTGARKWVGRGRQCHWPPPWGTLVGVITFWVYQRTFLPSPLLAQRWFSHIFGPFSNIKPHCIMVCQPKVCPSQKLRDRGSFLNSLEVLVPETDS